ncbi:MAG: hypothetical protein CMB57_07080 [Euryarchaeota archaeon]|nr:hypothetical protein [Euryarchaeota archaeon]
MVNWSLDDGASESIQPPKRRRRSKLNVSRTDLALRTKSRRLSEGKVRKVINGEVVYVRIRRVVKQQA